MGTAKTNPVSPPSSFSAGLGLAAGTYETVLRTVSRRLCVSAVSFMSFLAVGCSRPAGLANGGFEDGLAKWTTDGGIAAVARDAHSGAACAGGDVDAKGWTLSQSGLPARKGRSYRVDVWLRAKGAATVALFAQERGPKDEQRVAVWEYVPDAWTPVSAYVTAGHDGKLTLRFAASSASAGDKASVFIDDVALVEATPPAATQVEPGKGFDDEPWMTKTPESTYRVSWASWRNGADSLQVAEFAATADGTFTELNHCQVQDDVATRLLPHMHDFACNSGHLDFATPRSLHRTCAFWRSDDDPRFKDWTAYENVETLGYRVSYETAHHVVVAKLDGDKLLAPKNYMATSPLWDRAQSPAAAFDAKGRLWVAYRKPRPPEVGWDVWLTGWTGRSWIPPIPVSTRKGMNRTPSIAIDGERAVICYQADDLPGSWSDIDRVKDATSGVYLTSIQLPDVAAAPPELEPLVENPATWEAAEIRRRFGDDDPARFAKTTTVGGEELRVLFGDLHAHSDTSVCARLENPSADDVYAMQRDFLNLDFACLTDHGEDFNPYLWNRNAKLARANDVPGKFTVFLGEEWASSFQQEKDKSPEHPYGYYGHRNIVLADLRFPRWWNPRDGSTPAQLWSELRAAGANFVTIPHQLADLGTNLPVDWSFVDETAQPVAEVFQIRGAYEAPGEPRTAPRVTPEPDYFFQGALKRGLVLGAIASPDHGGGVGKACVWAKENSRAAILDALRARRCYGTTGARIALEVRVDGCFMGEKTSDHAGSEPVTIVVKATCPGTVARISICRNGQWIHPDVADAETFTDRAPPAGPKWYYVRVEQTDGELAWSSPVWLGAK
jgi:hypothetical protein